MITNKTHTVDWNKVAHIAGVVIVAIAQCAWWLVKRIGKIAVAVLAVLAKVFIALVSVWASTSSALDDDEKIEEPLLSKVHDADGNYAGSGMPVKIESL
jgi:uncharacterized membrane protein YfcA